MDDESQQLLMEMVNVLEQMYYDWLLCLTAVQDDPVGLKAVELYKQSGHRRDVVSALFAQAYAAVESREASRVRLALQRILTDPPAAKVN